MCNSLRPVIVVTGCLKSTKVCDRNSGNKEKNVPTIKSITFGQSLGNGEITSIIIKSTCDGSSSCCAQYCFSC